MFWLIRKEKTLRKAMSYHFIASGADQLRSINWSKMPREKIQDTYEAKPVEKIREDVEKIVRILFGYGGLIKHAIILETFTLRELSKSANTQEALVGAWIRDCQELGILEQYEDRYTGEIKYRIVKEKIDKLSAEILTELQKLKEK